MMQICYKEIGLFSFMEHYESEGFVIKCGVKNENDKQAAIVRLLREFTQWWVDNGGNPYFLIDLEFGHNYKNVWLHAHVSIGSPWRIGGPEGEVIRPIG